MNRRSKELLAGVSAAAALAIGTTACGGGNHAEHEQTTHKQPEIFHIDTSNPRGAQIERTAARIIRLANQSPTRYDTKPPYSVGFTVDTQSGGKISYMVQTATPKHKASQAELVEVQQKGSNEAEFDLSLYAMNNGTWTMYCHTDPFSANGSVIWEKGQRAIRHSDNIAAPQVANANVLLDDKINNLNALVDIATGEGSVAASSNICNPNSN